MILAVRPLTIGACPGAEVLLPGLARRERRLLGDMLRRGLILRAGSMAFATMKTAIDEVMGATNYTAVATIYGALYTAAIDATFNGATANEAAYTSYARLALTNNTTKFAAGSGTTTYTKTWPSDAGTSWAPSTGGSSTCTYLGWLDGNAGGAGDHGIVWSSITSVTINNGDTPTIAQNAAQLVQA